MKKGKYKFVCGFKAKVSGLCPLPLALAACLFACACQTAVTPVGKVQTPAPTPEEVKEKKDDFSEKLEYVQKGAFTFIYVFRRRDAAALDSEDRKFLRANSPVETNQWVVTDDARAAIAGSNYQFPPEMLDALEKRFDVEDLSEPAPETNPEANADAARNRAKAKAGNQANAKPAGR